MFFYYFILSFHENTWKLIKSYKTGGAVFTWLVIKLILYPYGVFYVFQIVKRETLNAKKGCPKINMFVCGFHG